MIHCIEKGIGWGLIQDGFLFSQVLTLICKLKRVGAMLFKSVLGRSLFLLLSFALIPSVYSGEGEDVLVIFNSRSPESRLVAEHYLRKRAVPSAQMKGFDLPLAGALSREDYPLDVVDDRSRFGDLDPRDSSGFEGDSCWEEAYFKAIPDSVSFTLLRRALVHSK